MLRTLFKAQVKQNCKSNANRFSSTSSHSGTALEQWIHETEQSQPLYTHTEDHISIRHLLNLHTTLPTRDGRIAEQADSDPPRRGEPLPFGHHLVFFHPRNPEHLLRPDGTDNVYCPPPPFTRRMWASGVMRFNNERPLLIGRDAIASTRVTSVVRKEGLNPMLFVTQEIFYHRYDFTRHEATRLNALSLEPWSIHEERVHVYLTVSPQTKRSMRRVDIPSQADFSSTFHFSPTTLFRFSALTWNGHRIHLGRDYAQATEGYDERLVHGPLTALMLMETAVSHDPRLQISEFAYRAMNPVVVGRDVTFQGTRSRDKDGKVMDVWATLDDGTIGMRGSIIFD